MLQGLLLEPAEAQVTHLQKAKAAVPLAAHYAALDRCARELPEAQARTITQLAANLASRAHSDDDKARLLYAWLSYHVVYDVNFLRGGARPDCTPAGVLKNRSTVCQGYAELFTAVAKRMRLPVRTVNGTGRTSIAGLLPEKAPNHAWNVYQANGHWHLVDATWGAGGTGNAGQFVKGLTPFGLIPSRRSSSFRTFHRTAPGRCCLGR